MEFVQRFKLASKPWLEFENFFIKVLEILFWQDASLEFLMMMMMLLLKAVVVVDHVGDEIEHFECKSQIFDN